MDKILQELEARKAQLEKEYQSAMEKYRSDILKIDHEIVERSKVVSQQENHVTGPKDGWNVEHEGPVKNDEDEGDHLYERERVFDSGKP